MLVPLLKSFTQSETKLAQKFYVVISRSKIDGQYGTTYVSRRLVSEIPRHRQTV